ncbi:calponin homology domain-containing protein DDB_G0272472-like [Physella acuta]|uniref:calponin homology domain-containing protein DDB_G0272472-like n=1 Tax=Physella acuta TaxID=109671 RepID=UPI0027DB73E8|nr:calponin homology domain-containing protein DDB_G0272472-like [Physella acuta]
MEFEFYAKYIELAYSLGYTGAEKANWVEKKVADEMEREDRLLEREFTEFIMEVEKEKLKWEAEKAKRKMEAEKKRVNMEAEKEKVKREADRKLDLAKVKMEAEDKDNQRQHELELEKSKSNQSQVLFANRETKHESTGFSPFELELLNKQEEEFDSHELVNQTRERIVYGVQTAQENAQLASERHRNIKNKHRYLRTFERGDLVFVKLPDRENIDVFQGPFEVIKKLADVNYEINIKGNNTSIHIDRIKKLYVEPEKLIEEEHMACTIISESCNT